MRHERSCHVFKCFVGKCTVCGERFTTTSKLLWNAIKLWNDQCSVKSCQPYFENDVMFPLSKEQVDIVALRISYDMEYFSRHPNDTLKKMLFTIVLNCFNEHDYRHRKGCFKKTSDCRFHYLRTIQESHELKIDFKAESSIWYTSYGNGESKTCYPFTMESKRALPDVFLNTNNPIISEVFGFNNNVTMGNRNCIYYVTLYNTKGNQEEEQFPFLKHCTAIAKRLRKLRNQEREITRDLRNDSVDEDALRLPEPNFKVGLGHVLSGILAHLSSTVLSATMAWYLVIKDSRFQFSHDFSHILLSQYESWLLASFTI
jgi:hypothetical protein